MVPNENRQHKPMPRLIRAESLHTAFYGVLAMSFLFALVASMGCDTSVETSETETNTDVDENDTSNDTSGNDDLNDEQEEESTRPEVTSENVVSEASRGVCEALTRCCDGESQKLYFDPWRTMEDLAAYAANMPTDEPLGYDECVSLMEDVLPIVWLGSWLERVEAGEVGFNGEAAGTCLADLENATCGEELQNAIFDSNCFGSSAPYGGDETRKIFERTNQAGDSCQPIRDGFGGLYYGSCDPTNAFCCVSDDALDGGCTPYPPLGSAGTCQTAGQEGDSCKDLPLQLCRTGLVCDFDTSICTKEEWEILSAGDLCMEGADYLGACEDSYCDFDAKTCLSLLENNESCTFGFECASAWCDQDTNVCIDNPICVGAE